MGGSLEDVTVKKFLRVTLKLVRCILKVLLSYFYLQNSRRFTYVQKSFKWILSVTSIVKVDSGSFLENRWGEVCVCVRITAIVQRKDDDG